ncbi:hypothetical protein COMA2_210061 [Candidatus Nitrospira nitrificans]|uniref:Luciferase-like domain-containing protein n=1 Tax=Candidatus Nitrospira nitrificans TaxID=1742973 RepID=A0A0S4LFC8_9BACT|nr:hypothetical protein COMA2_210061 [Candidatus Nitrospira nitrificans]
MEWIAAHSDGWVTYPRPLAKQSDMIALWKRLVDDHAPDQFKPFVQSLYIDLVEDPHATPKPIHLGFRLGRSALLDLLKCLEAKGVNHVILNLKYGSRPASEVLEELGAEILRWFSQTGNGGCLNCGSKLRATCSLRRVTLTIAWLRHHATRDGGLRAIP